MRRNTKLQANAINSVSLTIVSGSSTAIDDSETVIDAASAVKFVNDTIVSATPSERSRHTCGTSLESSMLRWTRSRKRSIANSGALPILRPFDEFLLSLGILRARPTDLAEVAQPEKPRQHPALARLSATSSAASVADTAKEIPKDRPWLPLLGSDMPPVSGQADQPAHRPVLNAGYETSILDPPRLIFLSSPFESAAAVHISSPTSTGLAAALV